MCSTSSKLTGAIIAILGTLVVVLVISVVPDPTPAPFKAEANQLEALNALADWAKWLVSIQTAIVGWFVSKWAGTASMPSAFLASIFAAIMFFVISIVSATILLGNIPPAIEALPITDSGCSLDIYAFEFFGISIRYFAGVQHTCFVLGLVTAVISAYLHK